MRTTHLLTKTGSAGFFLAAWLGGVLLAVPAAAQPRGEAEAPAEQVELSGELYDVPPPWRGNRIEAAADPATLVRVPAAWSGELGIYVTPGRGTLWPRWRPQPKRAR